MSNFIEELYYGNINPQTRGIRKGSDLNKSQKSLNSLEKELNTSLTDEQLHTFLKFVNKFDEFMGMTELDSFITGFRLGAKFTYDTFISNNAPLYDYTKE